METVDCNLCGSAELSPAYRKPDGLYHLDEWFSVVRCERCGLGFVNPRPTRDEIGRYYPPTFYDHFADHPSYHAVRYARESRYVTRHARTSGRRLLDVGCANGDFPRFMRTQGWDVEGVEISKSSRPVDDFPVYDQEFPAIPVTTPTYDVVTSWAVFEHVHDPKAYFQKVGQVLKPGGVFAFLVTNFESLTSRYLFAEDVPRHLYFFTETTVRRYLELSGLRLLEADYSDAIYPALPVNWLRYYLLHRLRGRPFEYQDSQLTHDRYFRAHGLRGTPLDKLRFVARHPLSVIDRLLAPAYGRYEMWRGIYGNVTYVARRDEA